MHWTKDFYNFLYVYLPEVPEEYFEKKLKEVKKFFPHPERKTLLELGGGKGEFAWLAARAGFEVTMIDISENAISEVKKQSENFRTVHCNFYDFLEEPHSFDVICYWDGFGIGNDEDQSKLLSLIAGNLKNNGKVFLEIYSPFFWEKMHNKTFRISDDVSRKYIYDIKNSRFTDCWHVREEEKCQHLKCYSPEQFSKLLLRSSLKIEKFFLYNGLPVNEKNLADNFCYGAVLGKTP